MPNLATVLNDEIRRLARREAKAQLADLRTASSRYRRDIAELKRRVAEQDRAIARMRKQKSSSAQVASAGEQSFRFSPAWVAKHRAKVGLSAADYAALLGVSGQTVYNRESGKTRPQQTQVPC